MGDLGKLPWLSFFHSDKYRVIAMLVVALAGLLGSLGGKLLDTWRIDRQDDRRHKEAMAKIAKAIESALSSPKSHAPEKKDD